MRSWEEFFQFGKDTEFKVDGPLSYNGKGKVIERTDTVLEIEVSMPKFDLLGFHIPEAELVIRLDCVNEGSGNHGAIIHNGTECPDSDVTIVSGPRKRTVSPSIKIPGYELESFSFKNEKNNEKEIDFDLVYNGRPFDFDLEKG